MSGRNALRTVRFTPEETKEVAAYLKGNPIFESFSSLARIATLAFIGKGFDLRLQPATLFKEEKHPSFLWDYDLSSQQAREILSRRGFENKKRWLIEKILTEARFDEAVEFLDLKELEKILPQLKIPEKIKNHWTYALKRWSLT